MPNAMPVIDEAFCGTWTEQDRDLYNHYPFYFAKMQVERRSTWTVWDKVVGKVPWKPNMGPIMRGIRKNPSPHLRQFAYPNPVSGNPKKDIMDVRETTFDAIIYSQDFESPVFNFYPDFVNFMSHIDDNGTDIMEKIERFGELFLRTNIYHMSPFVFVCTPLGIQRVACPFWLGGTAFTEGVDGKTAAWVQALVPTITGNLSLQCVNGAYVYLENDLRVPFFSGSDLPKDGQGLSGKYLLIQDSESWGEFTFDPYLQQNKNCALDVVNGSFKGDLFGRVVSRIEDLPLRFHTDGTYSPPEIRVEGGVPYNLGETLPHPDYVGLDREQSPIGVAWMCGAKGYDSIPVGPPPSPFSSSSPPENFPKMQWNGEVRLTKNLLTFCVDAVTGNLIPQTNSYGKYCKFESEATYGIISKQRRNIVPIFYLRKRTGVA